MNLKEVNACFCRFQRTSKSAQTNTSATPSPTRHSLYSVVSFTRKLEIAKEKSSNFAPSCGVDSSPVRIGHANSGSLTMLGWQVIAKLPVHVSQPNFSAK